MKFLSQIGQLRRVLLLTAKLDDIGTAPHELCRSLFRGSYCYVAQIQDGVEPAMSKNVHFRPAQSRRLPFEGHSSKDAELIIRSTNPVS